MPPSTGDSTSSWVTPTCRRSRRSSRSAPPRSCWPWSRTTPCPASSSSTRRCGPCARSPTTSALRAPLDLVDGSTVTALEVQWELFDRARKYADSAGLECVGQEVGEEVLRRWEAVLVGLESDPMTLPTSSTGWPSTACSRPTASATTWPGTTPAWPPWTSSTTTCARTGRCSLASGMRAADHRRRGRRGPVPSRRPTPGPTSGASASSAGRTTSSPPTGTRSCSTSAGSPCAGCP